MKLDLNKHYLELLIYIEIVKNKRMAKIVSIYKNL